VHTIFESGLQAWAEIIGAGEAVRWLGKQNLKPLDKMSRQIFDFLHDSTKFHLVNQRPSTVMSFYHEDVDAHLLAEALSDAGVMVRSGYFCVHYWLDKVKGYPPLVRVSLGLHNRPSDVDRLLEALAKVAK
jgi:selenocysteine lyase/cysteine desulfurase